MSRRTVTMIVVAVVVVIAACVAVLYKPFPGDRLPEGAYARIAKSVAAGDPRGFFAYLETEAQWACYSVRDARAKAAEKVRASYPEPRRSELLRQYEPFANAPDGSDVFAMLYERRGFAKRLRKDLSGVVAVDVEGDRASVVTARGTRWPFRRRDNGIWGLTVFTAELLAESEKASRDLEIVTAAAADYERGRASAAEPTAVPTDAGGATGGLTTP